MIDRELRGVLDDIDRELRSMHHDIRTLIWAAGLEAHRQEHIMDTLEHITTAVAGTETAEQSAVVLIAAIVEELRQAASSPAAIEDLANRLEASNAALSAAVAAVPTPVVEPTPADAPPVDEPAPVDDTPAV